MDETDSTRAGRLVGERRFREQRWLHIGLIAALFLALGFAAIFALFG